MAARKRVQPDRKPRGPVKGAGVPVQVKMLTLYDRMHVQEQTLDAMIEAPDASLIPCDAREMSCFLPIMISVSSLRKAKLELGKSRAEAEEKNSRRGKKE